MRFRILALVATCAFALANLPAALANAATEQIVFVDGGSPLAADTNPGTATEPVRTIARAVTMAAANNVAGIATTIRVMPAVYRERVTVGPGTTSAPLTIEAAAPGVVVSGADIHTDLTPHSAGVWSTPWSNTWGFAPLPAGWPTVEDVLRRREIVAVNGTILRQVLSEADLANGSFFVDESAGRLLIRPPSGIDLAATAVEVASRPHTLTVTRRDNVTIRGLSFRLAASEMQRGGVLVDGVRNLVVEDSRFEHNNWAGFQMLNTDGATLRRNVFSRNGVMGLAGWRVRDVLAEDNHNSYNNQWRGAWANYGNWEDGMKLLSARRVTFRRHTSVGNRGNGLWFDTDVADVTVEDSFLADNTRYGIFTEISQGPFVIRRNRMCGNGVVGLMNVKSRSVTVEHNEIFANAAEAVAFSGPIGPVTITNWETGEVLSLRNENFVLANNVISQGAARLVRNNLHTEDWDHLTQTLLSSGNRWHSTHNGPFTLPGLWVDFGTWRSATGQDGASVFAAPTTPLLCTSPLPPEPAAVTPPAPAPTTPEPEPTASPGPVPTASPSPTPQPDPTPTPKAPRDETKLGKPQMIVRKK